MSLSDYHQGSGKRILAGVSGSIHKGTGQVSLTIAPAVGMDEHLARALMLVADSLDLDIVVGSVDTGGHVANSRHYKGCAADLIRVGSFGKPPLTASMTNQHAVELFDYLRGAGWRIGEGGPWPGLLLGPIHTRYNPTAINHSHHLHVSINPSHPASEGAGDSELGGEMTIADE